MATHNPLLVDSIVAADDLSAEQFKFIALGTSTKTGQAVRAGTAGMVVLGVLLNKPKAGEEALYQFVGRAKVKCAGTISAGAMITTNNAGVAIAATDGGVASTDVTGSNVIGQYLGSSTSVDGEVIEFLFAGRVGVNP